MQFGQFCHLQTGREGGRAESKGGINWEKELSVLWRGRSNIQTGYMALFPKDPGFQLWAECQ